MKRISFKLFLIGFLLILSGCAGTPERQKDTTEFKAVIVSDLHYTQNKGTVSTIIPLISAAGKCYEAFFREVLDIHPDVLIITGDNTNSGNADDAHALYEMLKPVKDAGIRIVMTTGNHDFNNMSPAGYEEIYFPLFDIHSRDKASLSYSVLEKGVLMLAMDDCTDSRNTAASFSKDTMKWMRGQLKEADDNGWRILFCSHHSVLSNAGGSYTITNKDLADTLRKADVQLCLTGHQHSQHILRDGSLYEVITAMPLSGAHLYGNLVMNETGIHYHTKSIDFQTYGDDELKVFIAEAEQRSSDNFRTTFTSMFEVDGVAEEEMKDCLECAAILMQAQSEGTLGREAEKIRQHPGYERMLKALQPTNYGPWINNMMEHPSDSNHLEIH